MAEYTIKTPYYEGTVTLRWDKYMSDGTPALLLVETKMHEPVATASVSIAGSNLQPKEILIKGWSENDGIPQELIRLGIIGPVKRVVSSGYVAATVHDILIERK